MFSQREMIFLGGPKLTTFKSASHLQIPHSGLNDFIWRHPTAASEVKLCANPINIMGKKLRTGWFQIAPIAVVSLLHSRNKNGFRLLQIAKPVQDSLKVFSYGIISKKMVFLTQEWPELSVNMFPFRTFTIFLLFIDIPNWQHNRSPKLTIFQLHHTWVCIFWVPPSNPGLTWQVVLSVTPQTILWMPSTHTFNSILL